MVHVATDGAPYDSALQTQTAQTFQFSINSFTYIRLRVADEFLRRGSSAISSRSKQPSRGKVAAGRVHDSVVCLAQ